MTCKVDGCYAVTFRRNLCRNHFYMWSDQTAAPGPTRKGYSERRLAPIRKHNEPPYIGPCRCAQPNPQHIALFDCYQCANCGMPLKSSA